MLLQSLFTFDDKTVHMVAFFVAGLTASLAARSVIWPVLTLAGLAGIVELLQIFVPGRSASAIDLVASMVGVVGGLALGAVLWSVLIKKGTSRA